MPWGVLCLLGKYAAALATAWFHAVHGGVGRPPLLDSIVLSVVPPPVFLGRPSL